jgi:hypothetical protein
MGIDAVLGSIGTYVLVISALALGVERIMDLLKLFATKHLVREEPPSVKGEAPDQEAEESIRAHRKQDDARKRRVRTLAIPIGIILAIIAQIDTFDMLGFPSPIWLGFPILGWVLSGLAASRGSAFWHDIIELVRAVKETRSATARQQAEDRVVTARGGASGGGSVE